MADIFYAILIFWVLYRIFGGFSVKKFVHPRNNPAQSRKQEGDVTISSNKNNNKRTSGDEGEYVDYEEVK
jgi:hypothetical protein